MCGRVCSGKGDETQPKQEMSKECSNCIFNFTSNPEVEKHLSTNHKNNDTIHTFLSLSLGQFHLSIH